MSSDFPVKQMYGDESDRGRRRFGCEKEDGLEQPLWILDTTSEDRNAEPWRRLAETLQHKWS